MNKLAILKFCSNRTAVKSQRSKDIDKAALKFTKAVKDAITYDEMFNLTPSYKNLSKAILSDSSNKNLAKSIINDLHFMCLLKIRLIHQTK